jgi:hypothetical protein
MKNYFAKEFKKWAQMVGGIITEKHGATVGEIIVAAVATQQWLSPKKHLLSSQTQLP